MPDRSDPPRADDGDSPRPGDVGRRWVMAGLAAFIVVAGVVVVLTGGGGSAGGDGHLDVAFVAPDGAEVELSSFAGTPMVVNFFASWCAPCRAEMPDFEAVHQALGDQVRFVGLAFNDPVEEAASIIDETGVTYTWGVDTDGDIFDAYDAGVMPTTVLVAADGTIVDVHGGILTEAELTSRAQELIG